ncbi:hypothetical protein O6H91_11G050900 [Diphasiastrum complanatum]|uniref:Uncharacterized protein n=1 Tax=Diphasiastrum complanatum TaxID=34168 RepID=A0ACC2C8Z1_DIPCM|nr:hypothetical protein O6H91_11G050900 [Diphasiastrum complanatum]
MLARRILAIAMPHLLPYSLLCNASCSCVCWLIFWVCASWQPLVAADSSTSSTVESCFPGRASSPQIVTQEPRLVAEDPFGKKFQVDLSNQDSIPLLHVYGSPYELGRAHGALLKFEIQNMYFEFFRYLENLAINALHLNILPDMLARCLARLMVNFALDLTYLLTWKFTPSRYVDEMVGLADGANVNYRDVVRIQMFPELSKASCSMLGSWGSATFDTSKAGSLYQLRALDWDMTSPIIGFHTIIFFHPADGNQFAIFTWSGFIGCVTGYSGMLGVSEKVTLEKPKHQPPGVVFIDKYVQPSNDPCMEDLVNNSYGVLNGTSLLKMVSVLRSGDMHIAIYDFSANLVYFSWAVMNQTMKTIQLAYKRPFLKIDMGSLLQSNART